MTLPGRPGIPGAGFVLQEPSELLAVNKAILKELRSQGGLGRGIGGEATRGGGDLGILGQVDTTAGALTNLRVPIPNLKEIYIADWPFELTSLLIRLNDPRAPGIEILRFGRRIVTRFPIKEIYITTPQTLSGQIVITAGDIQISDVPWSLLNPLSFEQRRKHTRLQNQGASTNAPVTIPALNQAGLFYSNFGATSTGTQVILQSIPANARLRVYGHVSAHAASLSPNFIDFHLAMTDASSVILNRLFVVDSGPLVDHWEFDREYFLLREVSEVLWTLNDLGPAGNSFDVNIWLEIHPL